MSLHHNNGIRVEGVWGCGNKGIVRASLGKVFVQEGGIRDLESVYCLLVNTYEGVFLNFSE